MATIQMKKTTGELLPSGVYYSGEDPEETIKRLQLLSADLRTLGIEVPNEPTGYTISLTRVAAD